ncbi:hypothetical protein HDU87_004800 [Geranomyces variabilis]|uniref:EF-hand domain-containing protein n=1 Tax=Geranomyces variabilis TaxID=109894 RepID=A0AAD5TKA1_9FUNG|nr:hypothetical protein HDU87_004800 [Geranomyces variabilis]
MSANHKADELFKTFDYNGNGILSLAEIDRAVIECFPQYANEKPVLMRAYKAADASKDGFVDKKEFARLIEYLNLYDGYFKKFQKLDKDGDHRVAFEEFQKGFREAGLEGSSARQLFDEIDKNHGGYILFDEFCSALAHRHLRLKGE